MTYTYENDRIRVRVSMPIAEQWRDRADSAAGYAKCRQTSDQCLRGLILSYAMEKIAAASELSFLSAEVPDSAEILSAAEEILFYDRFVEITSYEAHEILSRLNNEHRIPEGAAREVAQARAWARGLLNPISSEDADSQLRAWVHNELVARGDAIPKREIDHQIALRDAAIASGLEPVAQAALEEALRCVSSRYNVEVSYRRRVADMDGWEIEVIGEMPEKIGFCRYREAT